MPILHSREERIVNSVRPGSRNFYPLLAVAISGTAYWGFYYTYFGPVAGGQYPAVSPAIHVHAGRSFSGICCSRFKLC